MAETTPFLSIMLEEQERDLAPLARVVEVEDNDRLVDEARLTFNDPDGNGAALFETGRTITVELGWDGEHGILFEGLIVESRPHAGSNGTRTVAIRAYDLSHKMSQKPQPGVEHPPGPLSGIVEAIAKQNGWEKPRAHITCDPDPTLTDRNARMQINKTDYCFLQDLAERYGARAFVEYNDGSSQFYFVSNRSLLEAKAMGRLEYCRGMQKLIEFRYENVAPRAARQLVATAVDPVTGEVKTTEGEVPPPASGEPPPVAPSSTPLPPVRAAGQPSDPARAERVTIVDPTRVLGLRGEGRAVGTIMLRAKGKVEIVGLAPWAEGDWYVSKATHVWRDTSMREVKKSSYETKFTATR